jgi:hypothetical protein
VGGAEGERKQEDEGCSGNAAVSWPAVPVGRQCRSGSAGSAGTDELYEQLDELSENWTRKSSIRGEIEGIRQRNLVEM